MTSRERLLKTLAIEPADRVPISCYELNAWNPHDWYNRQESYKDLMAMVREQTDGVYMAGVPGPRLGNPVEIVRGEGDLADIQSDNCLTIERWRQDTSDFIRATFHTPKGKLTELYRTDENLNTTWKLEHPVKTIDDVDTYLSIHWELPEMDLSDFAAAQQRLGEDGIMMPSLSDPVGGQASALEMGQFLIYAITETDRIRYLLDVLHERQMAHLKAVLKAGVTAGVDWSQVMFRICGPEYVTPPYVGPEYFAMFVTPYMRRMSDLLHEYGAKMRLHCHGRIGRVLDEIVKTDPDAIDPIEPPPDGDIELAEVKKRIGDRVCLFGNIELRLLEHGTTDEVRQFVTDAIKCAKPGGGFVIMPTAAPINVPLSPKTEQNYRVFIERALEIGRY